MNFDNSKTAHCAACFLFHLCNNGEKMFCFPLSFSLPLFEEHLKEWTISSTGHYCQMNLLALFRLNGSLEPGLPALGNAAKVM